MSLQACVKLLSWSVVSCLLLAIPLPGVFAQSVCAAETEAGVSIAFIAHGKGRDQDRYWIGVWPREMDQHLAKRLKLRPGQGVLVEQIVPDSPAAKAELAKGDVILSASGNQLNSIRELAARVQESQGKAIEFKILRSGKNQELEITPVLFGRRTAEKTRETVEKIVESSQASKEKLEQMLRQVEERQNRMREMRSGAGVARSVQRWQPIAGPAPATLPDDMEVTIKKRGQKPATVIVKQGQKMWKTTENELTMLPPGAQGYVARMLGRSGVRGAGGYPIFGTNQTIPAARFQIRIGESGKPHVIQTLPAPDEETKVVPGKNLPLEVQKTEQGEKADKTEKSEKGKKPKQRWHAKHSEKD